nr:hypothetical protein CFP56_77685 [Quercus suber]POE96880.1 hypothetical protein CFP56_79098 [Quercus suber]
MDGTPTGCETQLRRDLGSTSSLLTCSSPAIPKAHYAYFPLSMGDGKPFAEKIPRFSDLCLLLLVQRSYMVLCSRKFHMMPALSDCRHSSLQHGNATAANKVREIERRLLRQGAGQSNVY